MDISQHRYSKVLEANYIVNFPPKSFTEMSQAHIYQWNSPDLRPEAVWAFDGVLESVAAVNGADSSFDWDLFFDFWEQTKAIILSHLETDITYNHI